MTQRQTGKPTFSQTWKTNQEGTKRTTAAQPNQQYIQKEINFYTKANQKNLETTHNTKTRNTEMTQQEPSNTTIQTMNELLRMNTRLENITKDHITRQAEPQQAALTMRDSAMEARTPQTERQKVNDSWGHQLNPKQPATIQIILQNIGGIDMTDSGSVKLAALWDFTKEAQEDICAIRECNVDWRHALAHLYPKEQTRYWWESSHWSISNNLQETNDAAYQPGGTALVIMNQLSHRAQ